jgi:leader peptidase (prepilin peptidase)/N-methyltransferase
MISLMSLDKSILLSAIDWAILILLSLCIGSFINVVIYRLPLMLKTMWNQQCYEHLSIAPSHVLDAEPKPLNLIAPRSFCPHCKQQIPWWHNIPLLSFMLLRGKCAHCKSRISWRYPLVELFTMLLSIIVVIYFGWLLQTVYALIFTYLLFALTCIDLDTQLLPDQLTFPLLWIGLLANTSHTFVSAGDAIFGALIGYLTLYLFAKLFFVFSKKEGMGEGDMKLLAALGAWFGYQALPFIIIVASLFGSLIGFIWLRYSKQAHTTPIPFGPFLATAGFMYLLYGQEFTVLYISQFGSDFH